MSIRGQLLDQLARFDEAAFIALANRGLFRRAQKDLEKASIQIVEDAAETLRIRFDGQEIRFDARGPAFASCSCPASGVCQHILAAALALQRSGSTAAASASTQAPPNASGSELHEALIGIPSAALTKHAGKAGYRWAWQFVQDLDREQDLELSADRNIVIGFRAPRVKFRFMGGSVEQLIADTDLKQLAKYQVAAVLAYRLSHGLEVSAPEAPAKRPANAALDLGKDHALAPATLDAADESRAALRASVTRLLADCIQLGLSHLSAGIHERFTTLAVWAQGAEYYRLAMLLRRIADHVDLLLERAGTADEHQLLDELAFAHALVQALDAASRAGREPAHLVGRARTTYEEAGQMELIGVGAFPWRSASGYHGLTMILYSPAEKSFFSCTDARPEIQRGFDPIARYKSPGPWSGLSSPAAANGRRLVLLKAQLNGVGRISGSESTTVAMSAAAEPHLWPQACTQWLQLLAQRTATRRSLLAEPKPMADWTVLQPARFESAHFDATRQSLQWTVFDEDDVPMLLEVQYSRYTQHLIERIEQLATDSLEPGTQIVARVRSSGGALVGEPLSLLSARETKGVDALHFDAAPARAWASRWLERLRGRAAGASDSVLPEPVVALPAALVEWRHELRRIAERGVPDEHRAELRARLAALAERCTAIGLACRTPACDRLPTDLLVARYVGMQLEHLLDDSIESVA